eukprot:GGOE01013975.1.p1 GENE.GGOE01013975.1~~GGOE01013975.1.p1  ORF type:complete len:481 (-),score=132.16 GGOE01013975.1:311-1753(-)
MAEAEASRARAFSMPLTGVPHGTSTSAGYPRTNTSPSLAAVSPATTLEDLRHFTSRALSLHHPLTPMSSLTASELIPLLHLDEVDVVRTAGFAKVVYNILCVIVGAGVLGLPSTLVATHWWGLLPMVAMAFLMNYSGQCLAFCALQDPTLLTYRDLGEKAFGYWGQFTVLVLQICNCAGPAVLFLVLMGKSIQLLLNDVLPYKQAVVLAATSTLPFCYFRTFGDVSLVSLGGLLASLLAIACVTISIVQNGLGRAPGVSSGEMSVVGLISVTARSCFAYSGHVVFPGILRVMKRPADFPSAMSASFVTITAIYVSFSALCYHTFGAATKANVLENLPVGPLRAMGLLMITAHINVAFCLYLNPVFYLLEEAAGVEMASGVRQSTAQVAGRVVIRTLFVTLLLVVAIAVPQFGAIMDLIGGTVCLATGLVLPLAFYWKLHRDELHPVTARLIWAGVGLACVLSVASTGLMVQSMVSAERAS